MVSCFILPEVVVEFYNDNDSLTFESKTMPVQHQSKILSNGFV
jgi:hypothetical protein